MDYDDSACYAATKAALQVITQECGTNNVREGRDGITYTTIRISEQTHDRLVNLGTMRETFDAVLMKLLDCYEKIPVVKELIETNKKVRMLIESDNLVREDNVACTTIRISQNTYKRLTMLGDMSDTFNTVIERILKACEKKIKMGG